MTFNTLYNIYNNIIIPTTTITCFSSKLYNTQKFNHKVTVSIREGSDTSILFHHYQFSDDLCICEIFAINFSEPFIIEPFFYFCSG